ncbi:Clp protease N-terminal domain-containing protein [Sphaerotilus uruguayifluvii]|uniref:Clp protease N-terminal domain-containing protein n=1 Tax=Sphaerotilus uruguayifluvii TaxID=2735897 RepID=UPI00336A2F2A
MAGTPGDRRTPPGWWRLGSTGEKTGGSRPRSAVRRQLDDQIAGTHHLLAAALLDGDGFARALTCRRGA